MAILQTLPQPTITQSESTHEHAWTVESRHATSTGRLLYVRCVECRARRVDLQQRFDAPPAAVSRELTSTCW